MGGVIYGVPETQEDRFIVPRFHLLGVATVGWFAFAFGTLALLVGAILLLRTSFTTLQSS